MMSSSTDNKAPQGNSCRHAVAEFLEEYFANLGQEKPSNLYGMVLTLVEKPLIESVMKQCE